MAAATLTVTAPLVTVRGDDGSTNYLWRGDTVPEGTSQASIDHLRSLGFLAEAPAPEPDPEPAAPEPAPRRRRATKG